MVSPNPKRVGAHSSNLEAQQRRANAGAIRQSPEKKKFAVATTMASTASEVRSRTVCYSPHAEPLALYSRMIQSTMSVGEKLDGAERLARLEAQVRQAFASFRGAESPNRPPLPAAHTIKQFIAHVESASVRDVDLEVADVHKCLLSLGLTVDDAALVLETLDPKASGYIDARVLAKHYLPNNVGDTSSGNKRSQFALASVASVAKSSGVDTDVVAMKQLHRKVLERVLVKSKTQNVKDAFRQYDVDKTGSLTLPQLRTFLRDHGVAGTDVERLIKHLDRDSHGSISFHAFSGDGKLGAAQSYPKSTSPKKQLVVPEPLAMSSPSKRKSGTDAIDTALDPMESIRAKLRQRVMGHNKSIREVFLDFDDDGNGHLDYDEFKRFMTKYKFTADETAQTIAYLDRDFSGTIDYDEFAAGLLFFRPPPAQLAAASPSPYMKHTVLGGKPASVQADHVVTVVQQKLEARLHVQHDTDSTKQWLRDEFQRYDAEHKRGLDYLEFGAFLVGMGIKLRADELSALVAVVDTDGSEVIGFDEFARLYPPIAGTDHDDNDSDANVADSDTKLAAVFRKHDVDKSGYLDYEEFAELLRDVGLSEPDILHVIKQVDHDDASLGRVDGRRVRGRVSYATVASVVHKRKLKLHDGVVSTREHAGGSQYAQWVTRVLQTHRSLKDAFNTHDTDGSGELDHDEFRRFLKQYGMKRDGDIDALLDRIDTDGSGTVSLDEFLAVFDRTKAASRADKTHEQQQRQPSGTKEARLGLLREKERVWVHHAVREHGSVENAFRAFDRHGHDELSYLPVRSLLARFGIDDDDDVALLLKRLDADHSGTVDLSEFLTVFSEQRLTHARNAPAKQRPLPTAAVQQRRERATRARQSEDTWVQRAVDAHGSVRAAFAAFDTDASGELDYDEFRQLLTAFGISDRAHVETLTKRLDVDASGAIDFDEFATIFYDERAGKAVDTQPLRRRTGSSKPTPTKTAEDRKTRAARQRALEVKWMKRVLSCHPSIEAAFTEYDADGSQALDHDEFRRFMTRYGIVRDDDIASLLKRLDVDGSGTVDYDEFCAVFNPLRLGREASNGPVLAGMVPGSDDELFNADELVSILEIERELAARMLEKTRDLRSAFRKYDLNGNGRLEYKEFRQVLRAYRFREPEIRRVIRHLDKTVSGYIDYKAFVAGFAVAKESDRGPQARAGRKNPRLGATVEMHKTGDSSGATSESRSEISGMDRLKKDLLSKILSTYGTVQSVFRQYDSEQQGRLTASQFEALVTDHGLSASDARVLLDVFDQDRSGAIEYAEFLTQLVVRVSA